MLPKILNELLPFIYISAGLVSGAVISTSIVIMASIILIATGILVLSLRIRYRRKIRLNH